VPPPSLRAGGAGRQRAISRAGSDGSPRNSPSRVSRARRLVPHTLCLGMVAVLRRGSAATFASGGSETKAGLLFRRFHHDIHSRVVWPDDM